jgi:uncharacterized membrane protein
MAVKLASRWTAAIAIIAVPIAITGRFYIPGDTELPGIALVLASIAALSYERPILAGLCIGLLAFAKLRPTRMLPAPVLETQNGDTSCAHIFYCGSGKELRAPKV